MAVIGFSFAKQQVRSTVIEGEKNAPVFVDKQKSQYAEGLSPSEICLWLNRNLSETLIKCKPDHVFYRLSWSYNKQNQSYSLIYPCAILELVCHNLNIPCTCIGYQAITFKSLGFPKGVDLQSHCTSLLGSHPPYWDSHQINSALVAIAGMK